MVLVKNRIDVTEPAGSDTFTTICFAGKDLVDHIRADAEARPGEMALHMDKAVLCKPRTQDR